VTTAIEKIDATTVKLTVSLTEAELAPSIAHAYEHIGQRIAIPGFRKGKVPAKVLEQRIDRADALEHAINDGLATWYSEAIEEHDLHPIGKPDVSVTKVPGQIEGDQGFEFVATVEVRPAVTLPKLGSLTIKVAPVVVSDADVETRLDTLRARFGTLVGVDRPAQKDDFVTIDLSASLDGNPIDSIQGTSYQVGSGSMLDGLDEAVEGLSAGEETSYEGPLAAGDHAGEKALIHVKVTAVKERELPAADDEFAQLASEFDTIGELKDELRKQVGHVQVTNQAVEARALLTKTLENAVTFDLPRKAVEAEVHEHLEREDRLADDTHRAEVTQEVEATLRSQIVLDQLADDLDIVVEEEELLDYMISLSRSYGISPEEFIAGVQRTGRLPQMVNEVARSKATAVALRRVKVQDTAGKAIDLTGIIGTDEADAKRAEMAAELKAERAAASATRRPQSKPAQKKKSSKK
jgi:trigger factor